MGMFDSVWINCPKCGTALEFQSKAGECILENYGIYNAPAEVAVDIRNDTEKCPMCKSLVMLNVQTIVQIQPYIE